MKRSAIIKFGFLMVFFALIIYLAKFSPVSEQFTVPNLQRLVEEFSFVSWLAYIVLYALGTMAAFPGVILTFAGAILFGTVKGTVLTVIGATIGASGSFFVAKFLGRDFVEQLLGGRLDKLQNAIEKHAFKALLFMRLVPVFPFNGLNYGSGLVRMRFNDYFWATMIGIIPGTFVYTYLFATVGERALIGDLVWADFATPQLLVPIGLFVLLLIIPIVLKRYKKKFVK